VLSALLLLGLALWASAAPAPMLERDRGKPPSLDGEWTLTDDRSRGNPGPRPESFTMTIRGDQMKIRIKERGGESMEIEFQVTTGDGPYPRTIDLKMLRANMGGVVMPEDVKGQTSLGLYQVQGNTLTLGMTGSGRTRPTSLNDKSSDVLIFTRTR
jgi:uncharacterized protein (TIGR03067 family)